MVYMVRQRAEPQRGKIMKTSTFATKQFQYDNATNDSWVKQYNAFNKARRAQKGVNTSKAKKAQWAGMTNERCAY